MISRQMMESQNGKFICVRTSDDFLTFGDDKTFSYDKLEVQNIDTIETRAITSAELENSGTQSNDFKVKVSRYGRCKYSRF